MRNSHTALPIRGPYVFMRFTYRRLRSLQAAFLHRTHIGCLICWIPRKNMPTSVCFWMCFCYKCVANNVNGTINSVYSRYEHMWLRSHIRRLVPVKTIGQSVRRKLQANKDESFLWVWIKLRINTRFTCFLWTYWVIIEFRWMKWNTYN